MYVWVSICVWLCVPSPAREPMLRPAPAPAARDCSAPREAMGFTEEFVLEVGEEPAGWEEERKRDRAKETERKGEGERESELPQSSTKQPWRQWLTS